MAIRIPLELKRIVDTNQQIIHSLKVQKARQDQMLDKYEGQLKEELDIPSNRFLPIYKNIAPFLDNVINSKLIDYEILKRNEAFIKELIKYNAEFIIMEEQVRDLEDGFDLLVKNIVELESKLEEYKRINLYLNREISDLKANGPVVQNVDEPRPVSKCVYCGGILDTDEELSSKTCKSCSEEDEEDEDAEKEPESEIVPENDDESEEDEDEDDEYSSNDDDEEEENPEEEDERVKPSVRKGFANLMKDFDKKHRKQIEEAKAKEKEKMDYLDGI